MRLVILVSLLSLLTGCVWHQAPHSQDNTAPLKANQPSCQFIERNLTVAWEARSYWCVPTKPQP